VLPAKVKELMALAIAVVKHCDGCIAYHVKGAARRGATAEEVAEALGVALLMDGGTASVYGPRAWAAYREFAPAASSSASHDPTSNQVIDRGTDPALRARLRRASCRAAVPAEPDR
jgi:AhpD family alkylhydroperoxidase